ncbi:AraC family transcriptional regulator [Nocardioides sp. CER19]|uniref:AraC family transcriptional regulator n=1 Tax=Nocardioides sp. CER19 TaxID=3038538 RepID=UPI0024474E46|nr:AraC family transcriptional regulator [Nocardioides sp. CER19]MDH2414355.1 AraC family transcriptional regulator [Nocardioides sp. CER19]
MARLAMPLASYGVLRTRDVDDARLAVAASLAPHRLTMLGPGFDAVHNAASLDRISLHYIDYGAEVQVDVDGLGFQLIQIPLAGTSAISAGSRSLTATPRTAVVAAPDGPLRMRYASGNPRLMVRVSSALLRERLDTARRTGVVVAGRPCASVDITRGRGRSWRSLLDVVLADLERDRGLAGSPLAAAALEIAIVDGLIASMAEPSDDNGPQAPHERIIKRAARLIDDHSGEPLGTPDVAEAVGLSVRALQAGFQTYLQTTPMAYLRHVRLLRVREALASGNAASVTDAAMRCGITHLGRLSGDYRAAFGESPSETLQRAR